MRVAEAEKMSSALKLEFQYVKAFVAPNKLRWNSYEDRPRVFLVVKLAS